MNTHYDVTVIGGGVVQMHSADYRSPAAITPGAVLVVGGGNTGYQIAGFTVDHSWIDAPVFDASGAAVHERGVTSSPGLYFVGMPWQHTRGSALLGWVKDDAAHIAAQIDGLRVRSTGAVRMSGEPIGARLTA